MKKVTVCASKTYDILIERGLIDVCGKLLLDAKISPCRVAILTDDNVDPLYSKTVEASLEDAGFSTIKYVIKNGEDSKSAESFISFLNFLASNKLTRSDILVALGGGVVGDLCGFCASSYLRGVRFVQIPTTLLSMVDSSVGGKTAINLDAGKNLAGAFYQPSLVIIDPNVLDTLTDSIFADGCAEVIKYGIINDRALFDKLKYGIKENIEDIIENCVKNKRDIVNIDERDTGVRQLLNLGHTMAHGVEHLSDFSISHGSAVAIGTAAIAKVSVSLGLMSEGEKDEIVDILKKYSLPTDCPYSAIELANIALSDKKRDGGYINLVIPYSIGDSRLMKVSATDLEKIFEAGV